MHPRSTVRILLPMDRKQVHPFPGAPFDRLSGCRRDSQVLRITCFCQPPVYHTFWSSLTRRDDLMLSRTHFDSL